MVSGPPVLELLGLTAATVLFLRRYYATNFLGMAGSRGTWVETLLAYAGIGALWLTSRETVQSVVDQPDYGVSAVWLAVLGALLADSLGPVQSPGRRA